MNEGTCRGGPLDGQTAVSRYPKGFLLVDKPECRCWIYEWTGTGFDVRDPHGDACHTDGPVNRYRAAEEPNYDVLAAPWVASHDDPQQMDADPGERCDPDQGGS